jgi:hypothetical protein
MRKEVVKTTVGWTIIVGHFTLGGMVLLNSLFTTDQRIAILLVLAPVFTAYFVSVVRSFVENILPVPSGPRVSWNYALICIIIPLAQFSTAFYLLLSYPSDISSDAQNLQKWLSGTEVFLGGTLGLVVDNLFPKRQDGASS